MEEANRGCPVALQGAKGGKADLQEKEVKGSSEEKEDSKEEKVVESLEEKEAL